MMRIALSSGSVAGAWIAALAGLGLAACSIPDTAFHATADPVLAIRPSVASLDVDEGGTAEFTVTLTEPPSAELVVEVAPGDADSAARIGISLPELRFEPTSFDQPQTITLTGLADADATDAVASVALTAAGVDPVTVSATVRDHDKVEIATDIAIGGVLTVNEASSSLVRVHLTHQPAADVRVKIALGAGPVTAAPGEVTFTAANYDADQTFTLSAPDDVNVVSEDQSLTFQAAGLADKLYTIHDVDKDALNISVTTPNNAALSVPEGGSLQIGVALTKQPSANTTVHLELQSGNVSLNHTDLTFTPQNFDQAQAVAVSAAEDQNTVSETDQITLSIPALPSVGNATVSVKTVDNDTQAILEDAPDPLSVTENQSATFGVALKFQPTANVIVSVSSLDGAVATASPGTLTFTPQNYGDAALHQVTVHGTDDNNVAANATSIKLHEATLVDVLAPVTVPDDDTQAIVLSTNMLSVPEGTTATFGVSLKFDPGTAVTVNLADSNPGALPIDRTSISFTGGPAGNYATPVAVKVSPQLDSNTTSETATVTVSGGGAPTPAAVMVTSLDGTVIDPWGWPTPFATTTTVSAGFAFAYQINVGAVANLEAFHVYVPSKVGLFRMALYSDVGGNPGQLVAQMADGKVLVDGVNDGAPLASVLLTDPTYFLVVRFSADVNIGYDLSGPQVRRCFDNTVYNTISDPWVTSFADRTCGPDHLFNIWITTYHQ